MRQLYSIRFCALLSTPRALSSCRNCCEGQATSLLGSVYPYKGVVFCIFAPRFEFRILRREHSFATALLFTTLLLDTMGPNVQWKLSASLRCRITQLRLELNGAMKNNSEDHVWCVVGVHVMNHNGNTPAGPDFSATFTPSLPHRSCLATCCS